MESKNKPKYIEFKTPEEIFVLITRVGLKIFNDRAVPSFIRLYKDDPKILHMDIGSFRMKIGFVRIHMIPKDKEKEPIILLEKNIASSSENIKYKTPLEALKKEKEEVEFITLETNMTGKNTLDIFQINQEMINQAEEIQQKEEESKKGEHFKQKQETEKRMEEVRKKIDDFLK